MIKVGIIGGAGYTAGELIRILIHHPQAAIAYVQSNSQAGKPVSSIHQDLIGECQLLFTDRVSLDVDALFLCMGHGKSKQFLTENKVPEEVAVIDLSNEYRLDDHFVYGLPELHREAISKSMRIANCGCFATAIQLGLLPLAKAQLLKEDVHVHAITGSTGAGQAPTSTTHFSWRNNNLSIYKAFRHQHLDEIWRSIRFLQKDYEGELNFLPLRGDFARGIFASLYTRCELSEEELKNLYKDYYRKEPFTSVTDQNPHLKQVVNTNKCLIHVEKHGDKALIVSLIDNLVKGASGQAVQNMNLIFGFEETAGLRLKAMAF